MLESLLNLVKEHAGDAIINNPAIPNERNDEAIATTSHSIFDTLKNAVSGGNIGDLVSMFKGGGNGAAASGLDQQVQGGVAGELMRKFGLDQGQAGNIASSLVPSVLQQMVHKTNDPNDSSFDIKGILGSLTGGGQAGGLDLQGMLNKFTGGGEGGDSGGGILGKLKGLFGN